MSIGAGHAWVFCGVTCAKESSLLDESDPLPLKEGRDGDGEATACGWEHTVPWTEEGESRLQTDCGQGGGFSPSRPLYFFH